jgi:uncharacterized protein YfiM (DUF2279 family)
MRVLRWGLVPLLVLLALPLLLLQGTPAVEGKPRLDAVRTARARALLREHDPRQLHDGDERKLSLSADELALILDYVLGNGTDGAAEVRLGPGLLEAGFSRRVPSVPLMPWLNIVLQLAETRALPRFARLQVGMIEIPPPVANWLALRILEQVYARAGMRDPGSLVRTVSFAEDRLNLRYEWQNAVAERLREQLVPAEQKVRIREFHDQLVATVSRFDQAINVPELAAPLFAFAQARADGGDAIADNRAALLVLARYVSDRSLSLLLPDAARWPAPKHLSVRLQGRRDLAQHFFISALLAATGGDALANTVGVAKELDDARHGSGFSFIDLLADEAGQRFGRRATHEVDEAIALQQLAAGLRNDGDWLPNPHGLREHLGESEFRQLYGSVESGMFREAMADISQRLARLPLYR